MEFSPSFNYIDNAKKKHELFDNSSDAE